MNKGLLKWMNSGRIPYPQNFLLRHPRTKKLTNFCFNFIIKGRACKYGSACNFVHIKNLKDLPEDKRAQLLKHVEVSDGLEWTTSVPPTASGS